MYDYTYDSSNGGIILGDRISQMSNEPRPVYASELRLLGMDHYWQFEDDDDLPYMWCESNTYIYRGSKIARIKGGKLNQAPILEPIVCKGSNEELVLPAGSVLEHVNIDSMVAKNAELLAIIEQVTVKKIYDYYKRYKDKLDCFHLAFSGGKDSIVLLELVKRALPKSSFIVVFGDTGMEFPDTYETVRQAEKYCRKSGISFYRARSDAEPLDTWRMFGPPSTVLRWCCSVHKSAPQTLRIREVLGKSNYVGADFVGVRSHESVRRADYEYESYGKKQRGQYSLNPMLEWTSAEVWLYIFSHNLLINAAYKKGNSRAGCLLCPMSGGKSDFFRHAAYAEDVDQFVSVIEEVINDKDIDSYITNGGWIHRRNGRDIRNNTSNYNEELRDGSLYINVPSPVSPWREWIKTLPDLPFKLDVQEDERGLTTRIPTELNRTTVAKQVKQVFHKIAYCTGCRVCEANCPYGYISFAGGLRISDSCVQCGQCRKIDGGCLLYHSLELPRNGGKSMKSLNTFGDHAPKYEWVRDFYDLEDAFFDENTLGPNQIDFFKRFLADANLIERGKTTTTDFMRITKQIGWDSDVSWGLILVQLAYTNPQIRWFVDKMPIGEELSRAYVESMLETEGLTARGIRAVISSFGRLSEIPLGTSLGFGRVEKKGRNQIVSLTREKANVTDDRVILYSLYRFAEACEGYYQFTLSRLLDDTVTSKGITPSQLFGTNASELEQFVFGLSAAYPDYFYATFTHGSEKIQLREHKTSQDILDLFA